MKSKLKIIFVNLLKNKIQWNVYLILRIEWNLKDIWIFSLILIIIFNFLNY